MGRVRYTRKAHHTDTAYASTAAGHWRCEILLPKEHAPQLLAVWQQTWNDQRKKQTELTDAEDDAMATQPDTDRTANRYSTVLAKPRPEWNESIEHIGST